MRKIIYLLLLCSTFITVMSCSKDDDNPGNETPTDDTTTVSYKKYDVKSGIVKFEMKVSGTVFSKYTVYFDNYGSKETRYEYNTGGTLESVKMAKGDGWYYSVSIKYQGGSKEKDSFSNGTEGEFTIDYNEAQKKEYNFKTLNDTVIAGKSCKKFSLNISGATSISAGYKGVLLYYCIQTGTSKTITEAVSFEENATIDSKIWELPSGITITEEQ